MTGTSLTATSRRSIVARVLLATIAAPTLANRLGGSAAATKAGKNTIASVDKRVSNQRDTCELINGGTLSVTTLPSGTKTTFCRGGTSDGTYCKNTASETSCRCNNTGQDGECFQAVNTPDQAHDDDPGSMIAQFQPDASREDVGSNRSQKKARKARKRRR